MSSLRHIAVCVEEPEQRRFVWVLVELEGNGWRRLDVSDSPVPSYKTAMAEGLVALQHLVGDLNIGPRTSETPVLQSDAAPSGRRGTKRASPEKRAAPGKPFFGFGPAK